MAGRPREMDDFLNEPRIARVATVNANNSPHIVPFVYLFNSEDETFFISTGADSVTAQNLRRNPSVSICVDDGEYPFRAVLAEGEGMVSKVMGTDYEGQKKLVDHFYGPEMWKDWVKLPRAQKIRVRLTVVPKKWKWWDQRREISGSVRIG